MGTTLIAFSAILHFSNPTEVENCKHLVLSSEFGGDEHRSRIDGDSCPGLLTHPASLDISFSGAFLLFFLSGPRNFPFFNVLS